VIDFLRALRVHAAYGQRLIGFLIAFGIAEFFYKFHSFALECLAFLATWLVIDLVLELFFGKPAGPATASGAKIDRS
jgi:hypothetical protein